MLALGLGIGLSRPSSGGGSAFPITTPVLGDAAEPNIAGDWRPVYEIDFVNAYPTGGGIGDTLQCRYGDSQAAAEAVVTPDEAIVSESWWIDGEEPFPDLGDYGATLSPVADLVYQVRVKRGSDYSDWSNFKTLSIVDGVMTAPGWTDLTNQTASTRVWSSGVTVAGMASGAYARLLGTGPLKVGSTVYEAGTEVLVQNGDTLYAGVDTSATGGATVNNVVTNRGAALETFSATTVGSSADASAGAAPNAYNVGYGSDYHEFTGVSMTAGDNLIFVMGGFNYSSTDVLIDGASISAGYIDASESGSNRIEAYRTTVASTGSKTVRVDLPASSLEKVAIAVVNLSNCASGAPTVVKNAFGYVETPRSLGSHTIPADGIGVICAACIEGSGAATWTNATEIIDNSAGYFPFSVAKMAASATPTVDGTSWSYARSGALSIIFDNA